MENLKNLGEILDKNEQKAIVGGSHSGNNYVCLDRFPLTYNVNEGETCDDGSAPLCV